MLILSINKQDLGLSFELCFSGAFYGNNLQDLGCKLRLTESTTFISEVNKSQVIKHKTTINFELHF